MRYGNVSNRMARIAKTGVLGIVWGCNSHKSTDLSYTVAVVRGTVSTASGVPIANADVAAANYFLPCPTNATGFGNVTTRTDAAGAYRLEVTAPTAPAMQCVAVSVTAAGGAQKTIAGAQVQFKPTGDLPYDSVRVDLVFP